MEKTKLVLNLLKTTLFIVVIITFVALIFNYDVCYNYLTSTLLEELSFKYFFKFDGFFSTNDIGGYHLINTIIFVVGLPIGYLLYDCFLEKKVNPNGANTFGADIVLADVIFYLPFKVFLLGFAHALVVLATDTGVVCLLALIIILTIMSLYYLKKLHSQTMDIINERFSNDSNMQKAMEITGDSYLIYSKNFKRVYIFVFLLMFASLITFIVQFKVATMQLMSVVL